VRGNGYAEAAEGKRVVRRQHVKSNPPEEVSKYRLMAKECRVHAEGARSTQLRAFNLELAQYWEDVADEIERKLVRPRS
jgi:hypothetical protein